MAQHDTALVLKYPINFSGFTLLELMTVLIIIMALVGIAVPRYLTTVEKIKATEGKSILLAIFAAQKRYAQDHNGDYTDDVSSLDIAVRTPKNFDMPSAADVDPIGQITRTGSYTLAIDSSGVISCSGGPSGICTKLGF